MQADYSKITQTLDALLGKVDLSGTTEEGVSSKMPDGYYFCQVDKAELRESKAGNPMVSIEYVTLEEGKKITVDADGYSKLEPAKGTANRKIYCNYVLTNEMNVGFFVADMLKFQDLETNEPLFTKEDFADTQGIVSICESLSAGGVIYLMLQTVEKDGKSDQKAKPISWKRANKLELM